jgi:hypothetical protein
MKWCRTEMKITSESVAFSYPTNMPCQMKKKGRRGRKEEKKERKEEEGGGGGGRRKEEG